MNIFSSTWSWLFSLAPREKTHNNEAERLDATMKTTAVNRYNASNRLKWQCVEDYQKLKSNYGWF